VTIHLMPVCSACLPIHPLTHLIHPPHSPTLSLADTAAAVAEVASKCTPGMKVSDLCAAGDARVEARVTKVFVHNEVEKGFAFPTCVSVNECCHNHSPLASDPTTVAPGDVVKITVGVHIDGYMAYAGHTVAVAHDAAGPSAAAAGGGDQPTDAAALAAKEAAGARTMAAARDAAIVANTLMRPGVSSEVVVKAIQHVVRPTLFGPSRPRVPLHPPLSQRVPVRGVGAHHTAAHPPSPSFTPVSTTIRRRLPHTGALSSVAC
jgi:methionine aminopeptidase